MNSKLQQQIITSYPKYQDFMVEYRPAQILVAYSSIQTIKQSISMIRLTLKDIDEIYSDKIIRAGIDYISKWLEYLNVFSNINKPLTDTKSVAVMIFGKYSNFYLSDMKLIFEGLMEGLYGPFYGSVDSQRIMSAFFKYNTFRIKVMKERRDEVNEAWERYSDKRRKDLDKYVDVEYPDIKSLHEREKVKNTLWNKYMPEEKDKFYQENGFEVCQQLNVIQFEIQPDDDKKK